MRVVLADGAVLDTDDPAERRAPSAQRHARPGRRPSARLRAETRPTTVLAARIRHKFQIKNTTGYSLNALSITTIRSTS